jgi:ABC-2 type transport system permease protein
MNRYFRLFSLFFKIGLLRQMAYRPHFFMMVVGKVIRIALLLFFFQAIFLKVDRIGRWTYDQVLLLFATFHVVDYLMSITFHRNLASFLPGKVQTGDLDTRMLLPANLLFLVSFETLDLADFFSFLPSLTFLGYVLYRLGSSFSWTQVICYAALLVNALAFLYAVMLIIATTAFWTTQAYGLGRIFDNLMKLGRYPLDIFEGFARAIFFYVLPLIFIAQLPSEALIRNLSPGFILYAFGFTGLSLGAALAFWKVGLRNYLSASS